MDECVLAVISNMLMAVAWWWWRGGGEITMTTQSTRAQVLAVAVNKGRLKVGRVCALAQHAIRLLT